MAFTDRQSGNYALETGGNLAAVVSAVQALYVLQKNLLNVTTQMLAELQLHSQLLQTGLSTKEDLDALRADLIATAVANTLTTGVIDAY